MKTFKISCIKVMVSILRRGGNFQLSAQGERYVYLKTTDPGEKFYSGLNFALRTCNMHLRLLKCRNCS